MCVSLILNDLRTGQDRSFHPHQEKLKYDLGEAKRIYGFNDSQLVLITQMKNAQVFKEAQGIFLCFHL